MLRDGESDYRVGYGRPPLDTRFKRGQSGNPKGRPPGAKNLASLLNETLNEVVIIKEDGGRKRISKRKAAFKQLVNEAAKGNGQPSSSWLTFCKTSSGAPSRKPRRARSAWQTKRSLSS